MIKHIFSWIRLLTIRRKEPFLSFYKLLGFLPNDVAFYELAVLHKSSTIKTNDGRYLNNERLEFLGDAILNAIIADILYQRFQGKREGFLTNTRSKIVQRETLNRIATELGLNKLIAISGNPIHNKHIFGNAFEALIGAIYLDQGYEKCKLFIEQKVVKEFIDLEKIAMKEVNFKSKLIEWGQKKKIIVEFELIEQNGELTNMPVFQTKIIIGGIAVGFGEGNSKKESQQKAAKVALKKIKSEPGFWESSQENLVLSDNDGHEN